MTKAASPWTLEDLLSERAPLSLEEALRMLAHIARALELVHERGEILGYLSPQLIALDARGGVRDLACASPTDEPLPAAGARLKESLTQPEYASPELLLGRGIDRRSDLYSLGVIAYRMIAGRLPFTQTTSMKERSLGRPPPLVEAATLSDVSSRVSELVDRLLAADPRERPSSATSIAHMFHLASIEGLLPDASGEATLIMVAGELGGEVSGEHEADENALRSVPGSAPDSVPGSAPDSVPGSASGFVPGSAPDFVPGSASGFVLGSAPDFVPGSAPDFVPGSAPDSVPGFASDLVPGSAPDFVPGSAPEASLVGGSDTQLDLSAIRSPLRLAAERAWRRVWTVAQNRLGEIWNRAPALSSRPLSPRQRIGLGAGVGAVAATCLLLLLGSSGPEPKATPIVLSHAAAADKAAAMIRDGRAESAIDLLEPMAISASGYGDPVLHAALASAYFHAGRRSDALGQFEIVSKKGPSALTDEEVTELVDLSSSSNAKSDRARARAVIKTIGPRAVSELKAKTHARPAAARGHGGSRGASARPGQAPRST